MKINKFANNNTEKPFHTSGYAQVAHGDSLGATSAQSFTQRQRIEKNRQMIQRYRNSYVANGSRLREEQPRRIDLPAQATVGRETNPRSRQPTANSRQVFNSGGGVVQGPSGATPISAPRAQFREPPGRFNPYA